MLALVDAGQDDGQPEMRSRDDEPLAQRARRAFVEGAEEDSRRRLGRALTLDELERVLRRFPGDP